MFDFTVKPLFLIHVDLDNDPKNEQGQYFYIDLHLASLVNKIQQYYFLIAQKKASKTGQCTLTD